MKRAYALTAIVALLASAGAAKEEPAGPKLLPTVEKGDGLAAKYPGDRKIGEDPSVVFTEDFETERFAKRWSEVKRMPGQVAAVIDEDDVHSGERAVRIDYLKGRNTGGHLYKMLEPGHEKLYFRFYVKFPKDHGYVHHFVHMNGYHPATPWPQGGAGVRPDGAKRFSTGLDVFGDWGRSKAPGRWGFYSYWCEMKGTRDGKFWGNEPKGGKQVPVVTDRWVSAEFMIKLNEVGEADGEQAFWIDGKCAGRWGGYRWRTNKELRINAIWLLYYITEDGVRRSRGTPKDEHVFFDDVIVATEYIGPMK